MRERGENMLVSTQAVISHVSPQCHDAWQATLHEVSEDSSAFAGRIRLHVPKTGKNHPYHYNHQPKYHDHFVLPSISNDPSIRHEHHDDPSNVLRMIPNDIFHVFDFTTQRILLPLVKTNHNLNTDKDKIKPFRCTYLGIVIQTIKNIRSLYIHDEKQKQAQQTTSESKIYQYFVV